MDGTLWGVSRWSGTQNFPSPVNEWAPSQQTICGTSQIIQPDQDVFVCNGQLVEGSDDNGTVTSLAMYPKQPFDFAGRTGKVVFDVSNDSQGNHATWPEFWMSDKPVPVPFTHEGGGSLPQNGFGIRFAGATNGCVGVDSAVTVSNYIANDTFAGGGLALQASGCVKQPTSPGQLNHFEVDVSQAQIDVFGTDAGTTSPLVHLATISNANLTLTRGLIWIEDVHYNACKFDTQCTHAFTWDNVGFDGPVLPRDLAYDVNDSLTPTGDTGENNELPTVSLGWFITRDSTQTFTVRDVVSPSLASGALLTFNFWYEASPPFNITYAINGHSYTLAWPYPDTRNFDTHTLAIPLTLADVQAGTNTLQITPPVTMNVFNVDLIMIGAGGVVSPGAAPPPRDSTLTTSVGRTDISARLADRR